MNAFIRSSSGNRRRCSSWCPACGQDTCHSCCSAFSSTRQALFSCVLMIGWQMDFRHNWHKIQLDIKTSMTRLLCIWYCCKQTKHQSDILITCNKSLRCVDPTAPATEMEPIKTQFARQCTTPNVCCGQLCNPPWLRAMYWLAHAEWLISDWLNSTETSADASKCFPVQICMPFVGRFSLLAKARSESPNTMIRDEITAKYRLCEITSVDSGHDTGKYSFSPKINKYLYDL